MNHNTNQRPVFSQSELIQKQLMFEDFSQIGIDQKTKPRELSYKDTSANKSFPELIIIDMREIEISDDEFEGAYDGCSVGIFNPIW